MKKLMLFFLAAMVVMAVNAQNTYVLIVGVSNYQNDDLNLHQTTKDAKAFKSLMDAQTKNVTILTSKYANRANIKEKLRAICNRAQKDDKIIYYFSGHGYPGGMYTFDGGLTYEEFNEIFATSAAKAKICFVDACHAGSVNEVNTTATSYNSPTTNNVIYLMGCRAEETSGESAWVGHGLFTQALLKGMRGKADSNLDKKVTVSELFNYIYKDVQHATAKLDSQQHPTMIGSKNVVEETVTEY